MVEMQVVRGPSLVVPETTLIARLRELAEEGNAGGYAASADSDDLMGWPQVWNESGRMAAGLREAGVGAGDRVAILAQTSREWMLANHAIHLLGAIVVPVYPTLPADQVRFILDDAGARHVIVENAEQAAKLEGQQAWAIDSTPGVPALAELGLGLAQDVNAPSVGMDDPGLLIYTSGTTGRPKGVLLSHRNLAGDVAAAVQGLKLDEIRDPSLVAFLPLAHIAGYVSLSAIMAIGGSILFSRPDTMSRDLQAFRPTILLAVPRLWERIVRKIHEAVAEGSGLKQLIFGAAEATAMDVGRSLQDGGHPGMGLSIRRWLFGRLVFSKLLAKLGMDRTALAITGAAAVRPDLLWFLHGVGIPIIEGYGMTETSALTTCTRPWHWRAGTVGSPLPGVAVALGEDGEVLIGGIGVFQSYWNLPDETESTRIMMDGEPWVRSGDIGTIDADGCLRIVDRKKELEVLDTGKMIAPVKIEEMLKSETDLVEDSLLVGTDRKFASLLIQPAYDTLIAWAAKANVALDVARCRRAMAPTGEEQTYGMPDDLLSDSRLRAVFQEAIDRLNRKLADFEQVRAFDLVPDAFTVDRDELTPSFKKKRRKILANYKARVEAMYNRPKPN